MIYYLKAPTKAALMTALETCGLRYVQDDGTPEMIPGCSLDVIGPIPPDMACHANLMTVVDLSQPVIDALPIMDPPPSEPMRKFWTEVPSEQ
jgi:hypothetical protein